MRNRIARSHQELEKEKPVHAGEPEHPWTGIVSKLAPSSDRAKKITKAVARFIAKDLRPYSVVENQGFRFRSHTLEPK